MTPRKRVENVLKKGSGDMVPFTAYGGHLQKCQTERELRNRGLCCVQRMSVFLKLRPDVKTRQEILFEGERKFTRTYHSTPEGTLTTLEESTGFTTWRREHMLNPDFAIAG